jgi:hypothetical protein
MVRMPVDREDPASNSERRGLQSGVQSEHNWVQQ